MELKPLTYDTIKDLYHTSIQNDFPEAEIKPWDAIDSFYKRGNYAGFGLYEDKSLCAYAFLYAVDENETPMIDYFAVTGAIRGKGYGSVMIGMLAEKFAAQGIIIEVENPKYAENEERLTEMTRRIAFYERNGFRMTPVETNVFSVEYCVMVVPKGIDDSAARDRIEAIYRSMFPKDIYNEVVEIK